MELTIKRAENLKPKPDDDKLGFGAIFTDHILNMDYDPDKIDVGRRRGIIDPRQLFQVVHLL